ncbi:MAG TPA: winged helix-turn-helix domain-containing protein [Candidatus Acidoferrum sp.]|nr:winged helix-turn-helix domain-containing protein [Candidatus Methylomirabilis sp.]HWU40352.1 winged helix-turn-helix domain-containing protein [Candidatus Acidoferrum sp.]
MGTILVVEDEPDIAELVKYHLEKAGFSARVIADGKQAMDLIVREQPTLVVLDLMLPGLDGMEICRRLRANTATRGIPLIMLTAKAEEVDRIVGLEMGADDYVPKPFSPRELVARVKAVLRRAASPPEPSEAPVTVGSVRLDPVRHEVVRNGQPVFLSAMEFRLLEFFLRHRGRVFSRAQLLDQVWGHDRFVEPRTVDVHIRRLREKIESNPRKPALILTVRGLGYKCSEEQK